MSGVIVPQVLARYSAAGESMASITNIDWTDAKAMLRARYPRTMSDAAST